MKRHRSAAHDDRDDAGSEDAPRSSPAGASGASGASGTPGTSGACEPAAEGEAGELAGTSPEPGDAATRESAPPSSEEQLADLRDRWLRARAELENVRRAARLDVDQSRRFGAAPALLALIGVLDNLQRALGAAPPGLDEGFQNGLKLIERQFLDALLAQGVTEVPAAAGTTFDPKLHRALMEQPTEGAAPGTILHVAVPGYRLHDRLLREAQVVVARRPEPLTG